MKLTHRTLMGELFIWYNK